MSKGVLFMVAWFITSVIGYAGLCATKDYEAEHRWPSISDQRRARQQMWFCAKMNFIPFLWPALTMVHTAGFQDGFRWDVRPSTKFGGPSR